MLSAVDLMFLMKELKEIEGSKLDKAYSSDNEIMLQLHSSAKGKMYLKILPGEAIFITKSKEASEKPSNFAMALRKNLTNERVEEIRQIGNERIIEIKFRNFKLIAELFSKGNVILVDNEGKIANCLQKQQWNERTVEIGEIYKFPPAKHNVFAMEFNEFREIADKSEKESIVKILAVDFGLGGKYAEEACFTAEVNKNKRKTDLKKVYDAVQSIRHLRIKPAIAKLEEPVFLPVILQTFEDAEKEEFKTMSQAIEEYIELTKEKTEDHGKEKLLKMAELQKQKIEDLERVSKDFKEIGDKIYENYAVIDEIIKKMKETKYNYKHDIVNEVNKAEKKVVIEL